MPWLSIVKNSLFSKPCGEPHPGNADIRREEHFCNRPENHKNDHMTNIDGVDRYWPNNKN